MKIFKSIGKVVILTSTVLALSSGCVNKPKVVTIYAESDVGPVKFAIEEIKMACVEKGIPFEQTNKQNANVLLSFQKESDSLKHEGFSLKNHGNKIVVSGADDAGLMYGGLELAEQIKLFGMEGVKEVVQNPYMKMRGTKFNIPLDVRTPSYSDICDVTQNSIPEMWNMDFWKEYIDNLARYRYNFITLWNLHPFPSMVKVPGYEDIALEDVKRAVGDSKELYEKFKKDFGNPELLNHTEIIKKMTIEEKMKFWQEVMAYGKSRNVDFYILTWNIFVYGTDGKHGLNEDIKNEANLNYFRETIKQMYKTYPDLAGIGLTAGENMKGATSNEKEDWAFNTYAKGLLDAAKEMPERKFTFIHRQHQTGAREIAKTFAPVIDNKNIEFLFSYKYAKAHVYSSTRQPYHADFVKDIEGMKTLWELRNDDIYYFRWGAPDFVREFIQNIPMDVTKGYHYGSDQWIWGREFTSKNVEEPRKLEVVKHWYHFMMWGRLGYDPNLPNERFIAMLQNKFPETDAAKLFTAWQEASMIYPTTTAFHWGSLDYMWYIEACKSRPQNATTASGFHSVEDFIKIPVHELSGFQSIPEYVNMVVADSTTPLKTPVQVSEILHTHSNKALSLLAELKAGDDKELAATLHDINVIAQLGKYYAHKIAGSAYVAVYRKTKDKGVHEQAIIELKQALEHFKKFVSLAMEQHKNPIWMNRVLDVNWEELITGAEMDIEIAKK